MASFDIPRFERLLSTRELGRNLVHRDFVDTTMRVARELAADGAPHGTIAFAEEQTAGRGRRGRSFHSPAGENIYTTMILRVTQAEARRLPLAVPVAVCAAIEREGVDARIKWPNDIWIDGRKACGMLIDLDEADGAFVAFPGIGINVNGDPTVIPELRDSATSLRLAAGRHVDREPLLAVLCGNLEDAIETWDNARLADEYRRRSMIVDRRVTITSSSGAIVGTVLAVLDDGSLQLELDDGSIQVVNAGDVSLRPG